MSKRNCKIEFMRFFFCIMVILFHSGRRLSIHPLEFFGHKITCCANGYIGVEFFFLVSGFLMGKSVFRSIEKDSHGLHQDLGEETWNFWKRKYMAVFPSNVIAFVFVFIACAVEKSWGGVDLLRQIMNAIPNLFLIQKMGFDYRSVNGITWYISAMLIAMMILYPLCRRHYSFFVHVIGPFLGFALLGYIQNCYGTVSGVRTWTVIAFKCVLRAIAEISLGVVCFDLSRRLSGKVIEPPLRVLATVMECAGYLFVSAFAVFALPKKYEIICIALLAICITMTFSGLSYGKHLFDHDIFRFLGKASLPLYLNQMFAIHIINIFFIHNRVRFQLPILFFALCIACVCSHYLLKSKDLLEKVV